MLFLRRFSRREWIQMTVYVTCEEKDIVKHTNATKLAEKSKACRTFQMQDQSIIKYAKTNKTKVLN